MSTSLVTIFDTEIPLVLEVCKNGKDKYKDSNNNNNGKDLRLSPRDLNQPYHFMEKPSGIYCFYEYESSAKASLMFQILTLVNEYESTGWKFGRYHRDIYSSKITYIGYKPMITPTGIIIALPSNFYEGSYKNTVNEDEDGGISEVPVLDTPSHEVHSSVMIGNIIKVILKDILHHWSPMNNEELELLPHYGCSNIEADDKHHCNVEREKRLFYIYEGMVTPNFMGIMKNACAFFGFSKEELFFDYNWKVSKDALRIVTNRPYFIVRKDMVGEVRKKIPFGCLDADL